jgi:hypothetical protein
MSLASIAMKALGFLVSGVTTRLPIRIALGGPSPAHTMVSPLIAIEDA